MALDYLSSKINDVIRAVLSFLLFSYEKILHAPKSTKSTKQHQKAPKSTKKHKKHKNATKQKHKTQISEQK